MYRRALCGGQTNTICFIMMPVMRHRSTCADPESFVRGGPNLITFLLFFLVKSKKRIQISL